ncbi:MAG: acetyltransferase [Herminiimonas sp.]|uniref:acetyltransferase n=1 Tax=Herminiimonas sp. TaxID=1926289 RepID=UPI00271E2FA6|nr:acetyltransferase [Herminiimonas sp.]MDO9419802.1 acetyltransferase [Herminiimonas sp.]
MKKIILAGNAVTADILFSYLKQDARYNVVALTVDDEYLEHGGIDGLNTIGLSRLQEVHQVKDCSVIMAMGYNDLNRSRESMFHRIKEMGYHIETYIHPDANVYTQHPLGEGCVILPSTIIEPHVRVGANSMVWANVTLAHHSKIAENCWIASGAVISGQSKVERNVFIGVNATIVNEVIVNEYCIVGAGALITKNTKPSSVHLARSGEELRYSSQDYVKYFGV